MMKQKRKLMYNIIHQAVFASWVPYFAFLASIGYIILHLYPSMFPYFILQFTSSYAFTFCSCFFIAKFSLLSCCHLLFLRHIRHKSSDAVNSYAQPFFYLELTLLTAVFILGSFDFCTFHYIFNMAFESLITFFLYFGRQWDLLFLFHSNSFEKFSLCWQYVARKDP